MLMRDDLQYVLSDQRKVQNSIENILPFTWEKKKGGRGKG